MKLIGRFCLLLCPMVCFVWCSILEAQQQPAPVPAAPPPAQSQAPAAQPPAAQPPAAQPPVQIQEPENIERMLSVSLFDWRPTGSPSLHAGTKAVLPPPHDLTLPRKPYRAYGLMVTFPMKSSTRLEFSYLTLNARGSTIAPTDLGLFGGTISQGEPLSNTYSLRQLKLAWNYLTYPNPPQDAKFRVKTLWEVQYVELKPSVELTVTAPGLPLVGSQRIILPTVGLGIEYVPSKRFRMELHGSGMLVPHHSALGDAEGAAIVRLGSIEIFAGAKVLHFKTSPNSDTFIQGTLWGPDGGVRWVFR